MGMVRWAKRGVSLPYFFQKTLVMLYQNIYFSGVNVTTGGEINVLGRDNKNIPDSLEFSEWV